MSDYVQTVHEDIPEYATSLHRRREGNGIMKRETERLARLLTARVVQELVDDLVPDGEEGAACSISRGVLAIRASDPLSERSCSFDEHHTVQCDREEEMRTAGTMNGGEDGECREQSFESHGAVEEAESEES